MRIASQGHNCTRIRYIRKMKQRRSELRKECQRLIEGCNGEAAAHLRPAEDLMCMTEVEASPRSLLCSLVVKPAAAEGWLFKDYLERPTLAVAWNLAPAAPPTPKFRAAIDVRSSRVQPVKEYHESIEFESNGDLWHWVWLLKSMSNCLRNLSYIECASSLSALGLGTH